MTMVERVARAICLKQFGDESEHGTARCCQVGGIDGCCLQTAEPLARAAIEAMREMTPAMKEIYCGTTSFSYGGETNSFDYVSDDDRVTYWNDMIDAALKTAE
jgi:hypothetical protein